MTASPQTEFTDPGQLRKVVVAASVGNFVEWFDFAAYGFLATILTELFFPSGDRGIALLKTFAVFAVAFAFRPLGGVFFGAMGDRIGRKKTLSFTILLMAAATTLIGLLPTFETAGVAAPILLAVCRCAQGFSAGGEYAGACAYVMEHAPVRKRTTYGSYLAISTFLAFAAAGALTFALGATLDSHSMNDWGWRVPFLIAAPVGLVGLYLRTRLSETPAFEALSTERSQAPLAETLRNHSWMMLRLGTFIAVGALSFYTFTTYLPTYLQATGGLGLADALQVTVAALLFACLFSPVAGIFSDAVGRRKTIAATCAYLIVIVYPSFALAASGRVFFAWVGLCLLAAGVVLCVVVTTALLSEMFPTRNRYTASAVTYNVAYAVFGGTAPLVSAFLIQQTGERMSPAIYLTAIVLLGTVAGLSLPERARVPLHLIGRPNPPVPGKH